MVLVGIMNQNSRCSGGIADNSSQLPVSKMGLSSGYRDQSHLKRELQVFSGYSPAVLQQKALPLNSEVPRAVFSLSGSLSAKATSSNGGTM